MIQFLESYAGRISIGAGTALVLVMVSFASFSSGRASVIQEVRSCDFAIYQGHQTAETCMEALANR